MGPRADSERPGRFDAPRAIERPGRRSLRTRRDLVSAAVGLLSEQGLAGLTVRAVTDRADVGHGTFYHHFTTAEALLPEAIETELRELSLEMQRGFADAEDKVWVFVASLSRMVRMVAGHPALPWMIERAHLLAGAIRDACGPFALRDLEAMVRAGDASPASPAGVGSLWQWVIVGGLAEISTGERGIDEVESSLVQFFCGLLGIDEARGLSALERVRGRTGRAAGSRSARRKVRASEHRAPGRGERR